MNYFISDLHFGHKNILTLDNRPFEDIKTNDKILINNWNNIVSMDDDIYILGDISWYNATKTIEIFKKLNGNKHLIKGNHDSKLLKNKDVRNLFVEITDYKELHVDKETSIILCHYPIPCFKNHYRGCYHLYGHVHNSWEWNTMENVKRQMEELYNVPCNMYNVGCMIPYMDYAPRTLEEIIGRDERKVNTNDI